jgi:hypothetical protein
MLMKRKRKRTKAFGNISTFCLLLIYSINANQTHMLYYMGRYLLKWDTSQSGESDKCVSKELMKVCHMNCHYSFLEMFLEESSKLSGMFRSFFELDIEVMSRCSCCSYGDRLG